MSIINIRAKKFFDGERFQFDKTLKVSDSGEIIFFGDEDEPADIVLYDGIITPGFINSHCHLELSHMKGYIPEQTGLVNFVQQVMQRRNFEKRKIYDAIAYWDNEMYINGTVAAGDICNTTDSLEQKEKSNIRYLNFIEIAGFMPGMAEARFLYAEKLLQQFQARDLPASIVPHAPYSVSEDLFKMINKSSKGKIISIHNQETYQENLLFHEGISDFNLLYATMQADISFFKASGKTSIQTYLPWLNNQQHLLLIHNTFTTEEDILFAEEFAHNNGFSLFWTLCPQANLYIENKLPDVDLLQKHKCTIVLGTDSLSSNRQLDVLAEARVIKEVFNLFTDEEVLKMITSNGAEALGLNDFGRLKSGTSPGINLIDDAFNFIKKII